MPPGVQGMIPCTPGLRMLHPSFLGVTHPLTGCVRGRRQGRDLTILCVRHIQVIHWTGFSDARPL
ncbi:hypothetical protein DSLASN_03780 [Desulfoluna limicola]|uniref:Uncharacterized protein n=1 Tax=Desulfoluna limicola TaxID=2810562 RepID=A0ABM7PC72_9BACT|nr:hypothetical protein DSLASN_03780 [Desulfoluna limicola]